MQSYREEGDGRLVLTQYLLYLEIHTSEDLCITFYCDNPNLLKIEERIHTQDIDSSSWCTNPDHDVIMTLSALRTKLPFRLASIHVRAHQDEYCEFNLLPRAAQLNVLANKLASEVLADLRAADQPTEFYPSPACIYVTAQGTSKAARNASSRTNILNMKSERTFYSATIGPPKSLIPSIWLHIEQQFLHSRISSAPSLSNSAITAYQLAFGNADAALRLIPARSAFKKAYLICTCATLEQIGVTNSSISLRDTSKTHPLQPAFDAPS
jgi:hypothetical protein